LARPADYQGPEIEYVLKTPEVTHEQVAKEVLSKLEGQKGNLLTFLQDKGDDNQFTKDVDSVVSSFADLKPTEIRGAMGKAYRVKTAPEQANVKCSAAFLKLLFGELEGHILDVVDEGKKVAQTSITSKVEAFAEDDKKLEAFAKKQGGLDTQFLEIPTPVHIQSGAKINTDHGIKETSSGELSHDTIFLNLSAKYKEMCAMASRTIMVNPTSSQKGAYIAILEALDVAIATLKPGVMLKDVHAAALKHVKQKNPDIAKLFPATIGHGIGNKYREDGLAINGENETKVEAGMMFFLKIGMTGVDAKANRATIGIGDTVMVTSEGAELLTGRVHRKYSDVSYSLGDEEEQKAPKQNSAPKKQQQEESESEEEYGDDEEVEEDEGVIKSTRLRQKSKQGHRDETGRNENQKRLAENQNVELQRRLDNEEIQVIANKSKVNDMGRIRSYPSPDKVPTSQIKPGQVYVDKKHETVLVPVKPNTWAPFHISTIKNVSTQEMGAYTYLRLNFHVPGSTALAFPEKKDQNQIFMKELSLKNLKSSSKHLTEAYKEIQDLIKLMKSRDQEEKSGAAHQEVAHQEELVLAKSKRETLDNLVIRPNIVGKRTLGNLDIHQNGLRYASTKGHKIDLAFSNIRHAFFQPCSSTELLVLVHFHLKTPIMIGNKKVHDVQFVREAGAAADDIDNSRNRKKFNEMDELEQEERERKMRVTLNNRFSNFVKKVEEQAKSNRFKLEFDIPFEDLFFFGAPMKSSVKIKPTKNCLVALSEFPCFVLDTSDIEIVHFERIHFHLKNFDFVVVYKDFTTWKRISSVPVEHLEDIKDYLNSISVIFSSSL
jgi:nucleosome binding factor SPN SPT16 subunit